MQMWIMQIKNYTDKSSQTYYKNLYIKRFDYKSDHNFFKLDIIFCPNFSWPTKNTICITICYMAASSAQLAFIGLLT